MKTKRDWWRLWINGTGFVFDCLNCYIAVVYRDSAVFATLWAVLAFFHLLLALYCNSLHFWLGVLWRSLKGEA